MSRSVRVVARVNVRPEKLDEALGAFERLVAASRAEEGCVSYELLQNVEDQHDLTFVEEWASKAILDSHFQTPHFQAIAARVDELLTAPPEIKIYNLVA
jgi:quinol monooxygenase YgiN